jgi:SAM-dependent methyltransferase
MGPLWFFIALAALLSVAFTVFFGPPYLPTLDKQAQTSLDLLALKKGQILLELGSGDGRVLLAGAKRGLQVVGIELSPVLAVVSWLRTRRYRKQVRVICGNYFYVTWPKADGIFVFMIGRQMSKLNKSIERWQGTSHVQLASVAFQIPGKPPIIEKDGVFLYDYPGNKEA